MNSLDLYTTPCEREYYLLYNPTEDKFYSHRFSSQDYLCVYPLNAERFNEKLSAIKALENEVPNKNGFIVVKLILTILLTNQGV